MSSSEDQAGVCCTPGCGKAASMACPSCIKLGLPPSRFCSQECFKNSWSSHKELHKLIKDTRAEAKRDPSGLPTEFAGYQFTGSLRPYRKTARRPVPPHIQVPDYANHPRGLPESEMKDRRTNTTIRVYSEEELVKIRKVCRIGREVLDIAGRAVGVGVTCDEIDRVVHEATIERDSYPSPLNYHAFPKSLCTSVNEIICHGIPDERPLQDGDIINLDISVYHDGFHSDLNETFFVGNVDEASRILVRTAYEALAASVAQVRPGALYRDFGSTISKVAAANNCSVVKTYCGHGIGTLFHTAPTIPHYGKNKAKGVCQPGHVFTIEPMLNGPNGTHRDVLWPDGWTAASADGSRSAQFEHTMLVTENGVELLTAKPGEPTDRMIWKEEHFQR